MENKKVKEIVYKNYYHRELCDSGKCFGFNYYIINLGYHPLAYVEIPKNHPYYGIHYDYIEEDIPVHGGLTYSEPHLYLSDDEKLDKSWFIGWDYAHYGDYTGYFHREDDEKFTIEKIREDVLKCTKILFEMEDK